MASRVAALCISALFVQSISCQCIGRPGPIYESNIANAVVADGAYAPVPDAYISENAAVFSGGGFKVTSYSAAAPTGIKVQSDDLIVEGPLTVNGQLPFLGVVTIEGPLPATGQGTVAYGCGNGNVGISTEGLNGFGLAPGLAGLGCNGIANIGPVY